MAYDYLFYKSYQLAKKSKNFDDTPVLGGIWGLAPCVMLNIFTLMFLFDILFSSDTSKIGLLFKQYKYIFVLLLLFLLLFYFMYKGKWKRIISKYEAREKERGRSIHPIIVLIVAYVLSAVLGTLTAMYRNGDGIFS